MKGSQKPGQRRRRDGANVPAAEYVNQWAPGFIFFKVAMEGKRECFLLAKGMNQEGILYIYSL